MKTRIRSLQQLESSRPANRQAHMEIQSFLRALDSYPERFSREPDVSFEQHLSSLDIEFDKAKDRPAG
jgi:hypothetical protein